MFNDKFILRPVDEIRQRLFHIVLYKFLDKNIWNIEEKKTEHILIVSKKK